MTNDNDHSKEIVTLQRKTALVDNLNNIPPFNGDGNSVSFGDFYEKLDSFASMFGWNDEEKKFALLARLSGAASKLVKNHKTKTCDELFKILRDRYVHPTTPDVALSKLMNFKQTPAMTVQEFYDRACDLSLNSLVIDGLEGDVVDKSRKALLHSMLLNNLSPEIRKGVIARNPETPEEILKIALLEEKACKSVNPFYSSYESVESTQPPQTLPCAAAFAQKNSKESQNKEIQNLKMQIDLLSAKIDSLVDLKAKEGQGNYNRDQERGQARPIVCYRCGLLGHYARNCGQDVYGNNYGRGNFQNSRGRGYNYNDRYESSNNYRGNHRQRGGYRGRRGRYEQDYRNEESNRNSNTSGTEQQNANNTPTTPNNPLNV